MSATLCTPEKRFSTMRAMIALAFRTRPLDAPFFIPLFLNFRTPKRNSPLHHSFARGKSEIFYMVAGPLAALMAGIVSFSLYAISDNTALAVNIKFLRRIRLHTTQTFCLFRCCPVEISHGCLEFVISIPRGDINAAGKVGE